jgi:hypothetical protein
VQPTSGKRVYYLLQRLWEITMKLSQLAAIAALLLFIAVAVFARAQEMPRNGACFYKDPNYHGDYFCANVGESYVNLPSGFNDRIRSVRILGGTRVRAFNDNYFGGADITFTNDAPDLRVVALGTTANWAERISSLHVGTADDRTYRQWGNTANTGAIVACFFEHPNFIGRSFCVERGKSLDVLPGGFKDNVQSLRVVGNAEVQLFAGNNFTGRSASTRSDIAELRSWALPDNPARRWGEDISSVKIDVGRQWTGGDYDADDRRSVDNRLVSCTSQPGDRQRYCNFRGFVRNAYMVNSYGTCRKGVSWGIDNGRLWVSNGCSADFQVQP